MNRLKHIQGENGKVAEARLAQAGAARLEAPLANGENGHTTSGRPLGNGNKGKRAAAGARAGARTGGGAPIANGENGEAAAPKRPAGRQANGQFAKGNAGGPGNPFARRTAALRKALCEVVTEEDIKELGRLLLAMAKDGDLAAMKLLFSYVIGRPAPAVDPDTLDEQEWAHFQGVPTTPQDLDRIMNSMPAELACLLLRFIMPNQRRLMADDVIRMMKGFDKRDERRAQRKAARAAAAAAAAAPAHPAMAPAIGEEAREEQVVAPAQPRSPRGRQDCKMAC